MANWEYCVITDPKDYIGRQVEIEFCTAEGNKAQYKNSVTCALAELGADGWELVSCLREKGGLFRYYLKRQAS
jgi:hypothetical protein